MAVKARRWEVFRIFLNARTLTYLPLHLGFGIGMSYLFTGALMGSVIYGFAEPVFQSLVVHASVVHYWRRRRPGRNVENLISATFWPLHILGAMLFAFVLSGFNPDAAIRIGLAEPTVQAIVQRCHAAVFNRLS